MFVGNSVRRSWLRVLRSRSRLVLALSSPLPRAGALTLWDTMKPLALCEPTLGCEAHRTKVPSGTTGPFSSSGTPPARRVWHEVPEVVAGTHSIKSRVSVQAGAERWPAGGQLYPRQSSRVAVTRHVVRMHEGVAGPGARAEGSVTAPCGCGRLREPACEK